MAVSLFPHNRTAYENVCAMLEKTGKAAVIHPTGTGKSFIGFQYAAEHPQTKVLWLAPSEYIFRTQMENWFSAAGDALPNVTFLGVGIYFFSDLITRVLLGIQWMEASKFIGIWGLCTSLVCVFGTFSREVYRAKGRPKISLAAQLLHLAFIIPVCMYDHS